MQQPHIKSNLFKFNSYSRAALEAGNKNRIFILGELAFFPCINIQILSPASITALLSIT